jgi:hypothetical protein
MKCSDISWVDFVVCTDAINTPPGFCTTEQGDRGQDFSPGETIEGKAKCCDAGNGDGSEELRFVVILHEGNWHDCNITTTPYFGEVCGPDGTKKIAFEINLGPSFCNGCYLGDKITIEKGSNGCIRRTESLPFL